MITPGEARSRVNKRRSVHYQPISGGGASQTARLLDSLDSGQILIRTLPPGPATRAVSPAEVHFDKPAPGDAIQLRRP